MEYLARVNPKYFAAIQQCAAVRDVRYYLCAVHIERHPEKGVIIVATNGHLMAAIHDPDGWISDSAPSLLVARTSRRFSQACTARRGSNGEVPASLWIAENFAVISSSAGGDEAPDAFGPTSHLAEKTELISANFPDWRKVMNQKREPGDSTVPWVNGSYLELFHKVATVLIGDKRWGTAMHLEAINDTAPVIVRFSSGDLAERFVGMIMPMRCEPPPSKFPAWTAATKAA